MKSSSNGSKEASAPWRPRKYVLVGMGVIFGASAVTILTSMILQPSHISFFATDFSYDRSRKYDDAKVEDYDKISTVSFNLKSHNPSRRARVMYQYVTVSLQLKYNGHPGVRETLVPANVSNEDSMKLSRQQRLQVSNPNMTLHVEAYLDEQFYAFYRDNASATIRVFAQAQFKVGLAWTRLYNIRVSCQPIDLPPVSQAKIACSPVA